MNPLSPEQVREADRAIATLAGLGFATTALGIEVGLAARAWAEAPPTDLARRYTLPTVAPTTEEHLADGQPQDLAPSTMWPGHHYTLTKSQRDWLRANTALAGTATATVGWVQTFAGTQHPRSFQLRADVHKATGSLVTTSVVIADAGAFFAACDTADAAAAEAKATATPKGSAPDPVDQLLSDLFEQVRKQQQQ